MRYRRYNKQIEYLQLRIHLYSLKLKRITQWRKFFEGITESTCPNQCEVKMNDRETENIHVTLSFNSYR